MGSPELAWREAEKSTAKHTDKVLSTSQTQPCSLWGHTDTTPPTVELGPPSLTLNAFSGALAFFCRLKGSQTYQLLNPKCKCCSSFLSQETLQQKELLRGTCALEEGRSIFLIPDKANINSCLPKTSIVWLLPACASDLILPSAARGIKLGHQQTMLHKLREPHWKKTSCATFVWGCNYGIKISPSDYSVCRY